MMLLAAWAVFTPFALAQTAPGTANTPPPANTAAETAAIDAANAANAGDDRLPFMRHEETSEPADSAGTGGIILKTFGAMLIIVGLIFFAAWGLKKFGFGTRSSANSDAPELAIVSTVTVGSGRTISSIKFGSRILLVGSTPQSFTLLADSADGADDEPFSVSSPRSVAEMLAAEDSFAEEFAKADTGLTSLGLGGRA